MITSVFQLIVPLRKVNFKTMTNIIDERTDQLFEVEEGISGLTDHRFFISLSLLFLLDMGYASTRLRR